jgi:hypothetical protein
MNVRRKGGVESDRRTAEGHVAILPAVSVRKPSAPAKSAPSPALRALIDVIVPVLAKRYEEREECEVTEVFAQARDVADRGSMTRHQREVHS